MQPYFIYDNGANQIVFASDQPYKITEITGISNNAVSVSETQFVGQIGTSISALSVQPKPITVNGVIIADVELNRKKMIDTILPLKTARLYYINGDDRYYLEGTPTATPTLDNGDVVQNYQFVLHCPYPYWVSENSVTTDIATITPAFRLPFTLSGTWKLSQLTESLFRNVRNEGNTDIGFEVTFRAVTDVQGPEIYHVDKRSLIKVNYTLLAGQSITVSTVPGRKSAKLNKSGVISNAFKYLSVDSDLSMTLSPGDNIIRYGADNNQSGLRVSITAPKGVLVGV